jgi:hypothetical protein
MMTENGIKEQAVLLKDGLIKERDRISALISEIDSFVDEPVVGPLPVELSSDSQIEGPISIIDAAIKIIHRLGPDMGMRTPVLLLSLEESGHPVQGKNPIQTLYSTLHKESKRKKPRIERINGIWHIAKQQN